jgi:serine/threonine protein kinase
MGEVYLAEDCALGRPAALKLLPPDFSAASRLRLMNEARTSARLQHPCITTFYEAGEPDGAAFIAMEYVPGQTLRERLKSGPLPIDEAVAITACLLEALGHAHAVGILHRDIKPENIMLTADRSAKLLDLGIAKEVSVNPSWRQESGQNLAEIESAAGQTQAGTIVGTPGYMAPEQVAGMPLDGRADLFAVGLVLYEALTGRAACPGSTAGSRMAAALSWITPPLDTLSVTPELKAVLRQALARERADRFASAAAFLRELRHAGVNLAASEVPESVAVLDLQNLSRTTDDDWIGVGVADSLKRALGRISTLRVVAREQILRASPTRFILLSPGPPPQRS